MDAKHKEENGSDKNEEDEEEDDDNDLSSVPEFDKDGNRLSQQVRRLMKARLPEISLTPTEKGLKVKQIYQDGKVKFCAFKNLFDGCFL